MFHLYLRTGSTNKRKPGQFSHHFPFGSSLSASNDYVNLVKKNRDAMCCVSDVCLSDNFRRSSEDLNFNSSFNAFLIKYFGVEVKITYSVDYVRI